MRKNNDIYPSRIMNPICEQAGCDPDTASKHAWKWELKRWHWHPSQSFIRWFEPHSIDPESGASVGGHTEANRIWARKDSDGWMRRNYGISTVNAWNTARIIEEFDAWQEIGSPEGEPLISVAAPLDQQLNFWRGLKDTISKIGKKMPKPTVMDSESTKFQPY